MLRFIKGDIFSSQADILVNPVNCVGTMGKGLALVFKKRFPDAFDEYVALCASGVLSPGKPHLCKSLFPPQIVLFPTKDHWRGAAKVEFIDQGLNELTKILIKHKVSSVAIPHLGCGLGGLSWKNEVLPLVQQYFGDSSLLVEVYGL